MKKEIIIAKDKKHLKDIIKKEIIIHGNNCDLNHINVSQVIDMSGLFFESQFNGDISQWDVSNVTNMQLIFAGSKFNNDISKWDVSNVIDMEGMFLCAKFTGNINTWTPYALEKSTNLSENLDFNMPYWANLNSNTEILAAITMQQRAEIEQELNSITNNTIKHKIKL